MSHAKMIPDPPIALSSQDALKHVFAMQRFVKPLIYPNAVNVKMYKSPSVSKKACKRDGEAPVIGKAPEFELQKTVIIILA